MFSMSLCEHPNTLFKLISMKRDEIVARGRILLEEDEKTYSLILKSAVDCVATAPNGQQWKVRIVECPHFHASEIGNRMVLDGLCDFAIAYRYNLLKDEWWLSCRALPSSDVNLTKIVPLFDKQGGGHAKASGMTLPSLKEYFKPADKKF
jgi:hypothetical protein